MTVLSPLRPPFTRDTAIRKVQAAQDAWNSRDPERVSLAYMWTRNGGTGPSSCEAATTYSRF